MRKPVKDGMYGYGPRELLWVENGRVINGAWEAKRVSQRSIVCKAKPGFRIPFICSIDSNLIKKWGDDYNQILPRQWRRFQERKRKHVRRR